MQIVMAGASGFLGGHLTDELRRARPHGDQAGPASGPGRRTSPPGTRTPGPTTAHVIEAADVVVNLAGTPTAGNPHSKKWAARAAREPGGHDPGAGRGDRRTRRAPRRSSPATASAGTATTATRCSPRPPTAAATPCSPRSPATWQAAADPAVDAGARVCVLRTAPVMDRRSRTPQAAAAAVPAGPRRPAGRRPAVHGDDLAARLGRRRRPPRRARRRASGPFNLCCPRDARPTPSSPPSWPGPCTARRSLAVPKVGDQPRRRPDGARAAGLAERPPGRPRGRGLRVPRPRRARGAGGRPGLSRPEPPGGNSRDGCRRRARSVAPR